MSGGAKKLMTNNIELRKKGEKNEYVPKNAFCTFQPA